ncbi:MAG: glycosyltransferase family 2 protein [Acidobacteriota bacterium]|nr:glycosyltransferase family 2 protein [Acidobacteriota bacterium]
MTAFCGAVVVLSGLLIVYVLAGYPLLLGWIARRKAVPVRKDSRLRSVSFVVAVHNGEKFVADKLQSILELNYPRELMEILVVSDGSTDRTEQIVETFRQDGVKLLRLPRGGKPAALNAAIPLARNEILVLTDVRQTLDSDSVRNLIGCFGDPSVGVVSGELSIRKGDRPDEADTGLYWRYEVWIRKQMSRIDSTWGANGPFYAMRRALAVPIPPETLLDDVYLPLAAFFAGYRLILEDSAKAFDYPTSLQSEFRRKVRTQAGLYQILRQYPKLLASQNRMRVHFLSAKFGRQLIPFALVAIAVSSFGLPGLWRSLALIFQAVFYLLAALDGLLPRSFPLKRVSSHIHTFVVLMVTPILALKVFFVPARSLWKETLVGSASKASPQEKTPLAPQ